MIPQTLSPLFRRFSKTATARHLHKNPKKFYTNWKKQSNQIPDPSSPNSASFARKQDGLLFRNIISLCQSNDYADIKLFKKDLNSLGLKNKIPAFAFGLLIDQMINEAKFAETLNALIYAFLEKTVLDVPLFEDVLFHFVSNNYAEGVPVVADLFRYQFTVPSTNLLVILKEAHERGIIDDAQFNRMMSSFETRSFEDFEETESIADYINLRHAQSRRMLTQKSLKFLKIQQIPPELKPQTDHPLNIDPIFFDDKNFHPKTAASPFEIIESNENEFLNPRDQDYRFINDFNEEVNPQIVGTIRIWGQTMNDEKNTVKLMFENMNLEEEIEDYSTEEEDGSDISEDKI